MKKIAFILSILASSIVLANQVETDELSTPTVELAKTIHEFCLVQYSEQDERDVESYILDCVNLDLEISSYKTFDTYTELTAFISKEDEE